MAAVHVGDLMQLMPRRVHIDHGALSSQFGYARQSLGFVAAYKDDPQLMALFCPECSTTYSDDKMQICPADGARLYKMDGQSEDPLMGTVIDGRFRIDGVLGQGGMGTVYKGIQLSIHREVAIKVLRTELTDREVALERFFREAKVISGLSHPNIVRLIDFGQDRERDLLYLVMELVQGFNLGDLIREGRIRTSVALDILYQSCGALTEPHAAGVIHRDLKPDNILIVPMSDGTVQTKVLDFGIARALEQNTQITATGMICGTPAYMAPEQAQNEDLDPRSDLYALGVIMYEMVSGWPPFSGTSSLQIMLKHIQEEASPLRDLIPPASLLPPVEELTLEMMHKSRDKRPRDAREVRRRIDVIRRKIEIEPVRVEVGMSFEDVISEWLLPKLPQGRSEQSGPTEVLRRETGMEKYLTSVDGPDSDSFLSGDQYPTIPIDNGSDDERVKVHTRRGAQQAWTPGDQDAIQGIKATNDAPILDMDVFGATEALQTPDSVDAIPRKTIVESTDETIPATGAQTPARVSPGHQSTDVGRSPVKDSTIEARRDTPKGERLNTTHITILNVLMVFIALTAAAAVVYLVRDTLDVKKAQTETAETVTAPEEPEPTTPVPSASASIVVELAQNKVLISVNEAAFKLRSEPKPTTSKRTKPRNQIEASPRVEKSKPATKKKAPADTAEGKSPSYDQIFGNGSLRND